MNSILLLALLCVLPFLAVGQGLPRFDVNVKRIQGKTAAQKEKMKRALNIFEQVMNDESFREELLGSRFHSDKDDDPFKNWSTQQIVTAIYKAAEEYENSKPNYTADINWIVKGRGFFTRTISDRDCSTIGFFDYEENAIITYTCFFDDEEKELSLIVGHVAHEWTHALGFVHKYDDHPRRDETVPYTFGNLVSKYADKYIQK